MNPNSAHLHSNDTDVIIDQALSTLRDARPRAGLNDRIRTSLEHRSAHHAAHDTTNRATSPGGPSFHGFIVKGWGIVRGRGPQRARSLGWGSERENAAGTPVALWPALAACMLAGACFVIVHRHDTVAHQSPNTVILSEASQRDAQPKDPDIARLTTNPEPFSTTNPIHTSSSRPERAARSGETPVFKNCVDRRTTCPAHDVTTAVTPDLDAQALADLHTPSFPAPPLPLTPQEKLFIRMLRDANATQIAELNPAFRARQDAAETAAFKAFFPDPPPLKQPGDNE